MKQTITVCDICERRIDADEAHAGMGVNPRGFHNAQITVDGEYCAKCSKKVCDAITVAADRIDALREGAE